MVNSRSLLNMLVCLVLACLITGLDAVVRPRVATADRLDGDVAGPIQMHYACSIVHNNGCWWCLENSFT